MVEYVRPFCVTSPWVLLGLVLAHLVIGITYSMISVCLAHVLRDAGPITGQGHVRGFQHFVGACGISHFFAMLALFLPSLDWGYVSWLALTAAISVAAAWKLWKAKSELVLLLHDRKSLETTMGRAHAGA